MVQAALKVVGGKQGGNLIPLTTKKFLIGREQDCQLRSGSELVSRHHCAISIDEFGVRVRDLGSSNGTLVNGKRIIGVQEVHSGDHLKIGNLEFEMVLRSAGVPVAAPGGTQFSLNEFELDEVSDTAVMSGDTAVIDMNRQDEQRAEQAATEAGEGELNPGEAVPETEPAPPAQTQPQGVPDQPVLDPAAQMNPPVPPYPGMPQPGMPYYPQQQFPGYPGMPGYPYGMPPQPGYGMPPQYAMPYPQQPGYPPQPMPYPGQPVPTMPAEDEYDEYEDEDDGDSIRIPPTQLPDPSETGLKDEPKAQDGDGKPVAKPPNPAEEVLKKYQNRR